MNHFQKCAAGFEDITRDLDRHLLVVGCSTVGKVKVGGPPAEKAVQVLYSLDATWAVKKRLTFNPLVALVE